MGILSRLAGVVLTRAEDPASTVWNVKNPPPPGFTPDNGSLSLASVYRAVEIISTAMIQLPITVERGEYVLPANEIPSIIKSPSLYMERSEFIEYLTNSLTLLGNAFIFVERNTVGDAVNLFPLNPSHVAVEMDRKGAKAFRYDNRTYGPADIKHMALTQRPGHALGLGPIQAARAELSGATRTRDYAANWFEATGQPSGVLASDNNISAEEAHLIRDSWNGLKDGKPELATANPSGVKILPRGLKYSPILLSPKDAQWLEAQTFNTLQIARLFGVPSSLMMVGPDGGSMTYANVEQDWIGFTRFTLMMYMRKIESALTSVTVRGQQVRFNTEGLLRSDTKTRYESYKTGIEAGFLSVEEVRKIEGHAPRPARKETPDNG